MTETIQKMDEKYVYYLSFISVNYFVSTTDSSILSYIWIDRHILNVNTNISSYIHIIYFTSLSEYYTWARSFTATPVRFCCRVEILANASNFPASNKETLVLKVKQPRIGRQITRTKSVRRNWLRSIKSHGDCWDVWESGKEILQRTRTFRCQRSLATSSFHRCFSILQNLTITISLRRKVLRPVPRERYIHKPHKKLLITFIEIVERSSIYVQIWSLW